PEPPSLEARCIRTSTPPPHLPPLPLHDALPISTTTTRPRRGTAPELRAPVAEPQRAGGEAACAASPARDDRRTTRQTRTLRTPLDRKSTRLNSSHRTISYAVFCLKKKNKTETLP